MTKLKVENFQEPKIVYNGFFKMLKYDVFVERLDGEGENRLVREVFERGNSVAVLLFDRKENEVMMIRQFLIGSHVSGVSENAPLQVVAGMVDPGEKPFDAAMRETEEEAGVGEITYVETGPVFQPSPGGSSERIFTYIAHCDLSNVHPGRHGLESENEDILTVILDAGYAVEMLDNGEIENGLAVVLLSTLARRYDLKIRKNYGKY